MQSYSYFLGRVAEITVDQDTEDQTTYLDNIMFYYFM